MLSPTSGSIVTEMGLGTTPTGACPRIAADHGGPAIGGTTGGGIRCDGYGSMLKRRMGWQAVHAGPGATPAPSAAKAPQLGSLRTIIKADV